MYIRLNDFITEWKQEPELTARVFQRLTDESLKQPVAEGFRVPYSTMSLLSGLAFLIFFLPGKTSRRKD